VTYGFEITRHLYVSEEVVHVFSGDFMPDKSFVYVIDNTPVGLFRGTARIIFIRRR
jgi:hypothetical protein